MDELRHTFFELSEDHDVRVILLSATGQRAFCAGADLKEQGRHEYADLNEYLNHQPGLFDMMRRCPQIIVAEVNGWAVGGGAMLALFSDLAYASAGAKFILPQVGLGIIPPYGAAVRLARYIGHGRAMQMMLLGTTLEAEEAHAVGLVQGLTPDAAALREHVESVVQHLLELPRESLALAKNALVTGWDMSAESASAADRFRDYALKQSAETKKLHTDWVNAK
jgi:enoyl-CoA hydratase/carnithine racemase